MPLGSKRGQPRARVPLGALFLVLQMRRVGLLVLSLMLYVHGNIHYQLSRDVRKPDFCICKNKDADQLRGNREADQRLCFRYTDSTIPLLSKSEISSLLPSSVAVQPGLCRTWSETPKTGFLTSRLNYLTTLFLDILSGHRLQVKGTPSFACKADNLLFLN